MTDEFEVAVVVASASTTGQDRAGFVPDGDGIVIALADGAGGTSSGENAAQAVVDAVTADPAIADFASFLTDLDADPKRLDSGQTTAVIARVTSDSIVGVSVGDSGAWLIAADDRIDLTRGQQRKPLVGSGCRPVAFESAFPRGATLVVASDGLLRYAKREELSRAATTGSIEIALRALVDLVRLPTGDLQDDVSIVLCRHR